MLTEIISQNGCMTEENLVYEAVTIPLPKNKPLMSYWFYALRTKSTRKPVGQTKSVE
jgi:hypothetical protein